MSDNVILGLRIATLVLSIPSIVVSIISLPLHGLAHRFIRTDLALIIITAVILALSLVPPTVASILDDVTLFLAVFGTFLLPGMCHAPRFSILKTKFVGFSLGTHRYSLLSPPSLDRRVPGAVVGSQHAARFPS